MRWLADENFPAAAIRALRASGQDVSSVAETRRGAGDGEVVGWARREGRILLTFDKDFGELCKLAPLLEPAGAILFRLPLSPTSEWVSRILRQLLSRDDWGGCFSVIEPDRIRMRRMGS